MADVLHGTRFAGVGLSPDGRYLIANYRTTYVGGRSAGSTRITELASVGLAGVLRICNGCLVLTAIIIPVQGGWQTADSCGSAYRNGNCVGE